MLHNSNNRRGFTLVEILAVLVILATLAAIVLPNVVGSTERANKVSAVTQISSLSTALQRFEVDMGYFPSRLQDLVTEPKGSGKWHGPYLDSIPKDPWQNEYTYECPGKHNPKKFDISSKGPKGEGGASTIGNWVDADSNK
ncbi:TPA: type II secretion system protein GspG [Candidatus Sumerlaeota bacterium]|nr:type II secretion system protein GspG [Candidatus Sumerlaeota bacterium]